MKIKGLVSMMTACMLVYPISFSAFAHDSVSMNKLNDQIRQLQKQVADLQRPKSGLITNGPNMTLKTPGTLLIQASRLQLKSSAVLEASGAVIKLNGGNKPIATIGSRTAGSPAGGQIISGSSTILVP